MDALGASARRPQSPLTAGCWGSSVDPGLGCWTQPRSRSAGWGASAGWNAICATARSDPGTDADCHRSPGTRSTWPADPAPSRRADPAAHGQRRQGGRANRRVRGGAAALPEAHRPLAPHSGHDRNSSRAHPRGAGGRGSQSDGHASRTNGSSSNLSSFQGVGISAAAIMGRVNRRLSATKAIRSAAGGPW